MVIIAGAVDGNLALAAGAAAVLQKPISRAQLKASLANLGLHAARDRDAHVLVVDDDPKAVEVIAALPAGTGLRRGARLRRRARRSRWPQRLAPDLILLDLMMPDVNGFDVVEALQRDPDDGDDPDPGS